ncbi:MAG: PTS transporter subunit EIIC [Longicatena sp.]
MNKLEAILSKWLLPIAAKLEMNPQLTAIRRGMMTLVPVTLIGSIPTLFLQLPAIPNMPQWFVDGANFLAKVTQPMAFATMGCLAVYVAIFVGYYYAQQRKVWEIGSIVVAVAAFIIMATLYDPKTGATITSYYGGTGIFTAIVFALLSVEILHIFRNKLHFTINLGDGVPTPILRSFENLWPILFSILILIFVKFGIENLTGIPVVQLVEKMFSPLTASVNTLGGMVFILFIQQLLWWFGIHGYSVMAPIWMAVAFANVDINAAIVAGNSSEAVRVLTPNFMWDIAGTTGSGICGALCLLMVFSKAKRYRSIGRLSIVPEFFGIGEPVLFGLPVILNPIMFIPWLLSTPIAAAIGWIAIENGFMAPFSMVGPYIPLPFGAWIACMDWKYLIIWALIIVVSVCLYYPFYKIMEKSALENESKSKNDTRTLEDIEFDF